MKQERPQPLYIRVSDCQRVFGIHRSTIYREAKKGRIRIYKRGAMSLLKIAEMERYIEGETTANG